MLAGSGAASTDTVSEDVSATLVFVTDFGLEDGYAAELRAAAWAVAPGVRCVDGTHMVPPGDVLTAMYRCKTLARTFGPGTVLCAVVDPGVGSDRDAVAVECDSILCVAPDTGLVSYLWIEASRRRAVRLETPATASATFHGRDHFAPVAARLAAGADLAECGAPVSSPRLHEGVVPVAEGRLLRSQVVSVDHFGNCITGIRDRDAGSTQVAAVTWQGGSTRHMVAAYAQIGTGLAALWNSAGHLEIAAREASAGQVSGLSVGAPVAVELV
jgi:S-adenosylmethionine hydrolase